MATKQLGKLKLHVSKRGIAFKWGDGQIHRFAFDRFTKKDNYDGARGQYDDERYDDRYDDRYGDERNAPYDDDYGYRDDYGVREERSPIMAFLFSNNWIVWALLVVLPPLGIWLLWKRNMLDSVVQAAVSAASSVWFVVLLVLVFSNVFNSTPDKVAGTDVNLPTAIVTGTPAAVVTAAPTPNAGAATLTPDSTGTGTDGAVVAGQPTPKASTDDTGSGTSGSNVIYVYTTAAHSHYHLKEDCGGMTGASRVTLAAAQANGKTACPICAAELSAMDTGGGTDGTDETGGTSGSGGTGGSSTGTYYMTDGGTYYHTISNCSGMSGARAVTLADAIAAGKKECPYCSQSYYATRNGTYVHLKSDCSGMQGATKLTLKQAQSSGKPRCPVCAGGSATSSASSSSSSGGSSSSSKSYYATRSGKYYHVKSDCSGMQNASKISIATAKKYGKGACPVCIGSSSSSDKYYATQNGKYYHTKSTCSGMQNASSITLATALKYNKAACPVCVGSSSSSSSSSTTYVYATKSGTYYHAKSGCSGMQGASKITLATAKNANKKACPVCIGGGATASPKVTPAPTRATARTVSVSDSDKNTYCYAVKTGAYYHKTSNCSGMKNASKITVATAKQSGLSACPVCAKSSVAPETKTKGTIVTAYCYATEKNPYYHIKKSCSDMKNPTKLSVSVAKSRGKTACPVCAGQSLDKMVYVTAKGSLYHTKTVCDGVEMTIKASIADAVGRGYKPCSKCNAPKTTKAPNVTAKPTNKPTPTPKVTPAPLPTAEVTPAPIEESE